jgi:hypothetical protein
MSQKSIRIMISSRCDDRFSLGAKTGATLSEIRKQIKEEIEGQKLFGESFFEVWINEDAPPQPGSNDSWDVCIKAVRDCDVLIVLYNGNAGWTKENGDVGICHAELMTGLSETHGKVFLIFIADKDSKNWPKKIPDKRFQEYVERQNLFRGGTVKTQKDLIQRIHETLQEALVTLVHRGVKEASRGKFDSGQALDWSRLDFAGRHKQMIQVMRKALLERKNAVEDHNQIFVSISNSKVLIVTSAIPAAITISAAKEMVGQPFLNDHNFADVLTGKSVGPVHIVACHKNVTEAQAMKLLGFPDATLLTTSFGVYVADNIQNIQLALIANCRDETTTRQGTQRFFDWLERTGEAKLLAKRATSRKKIIQIIAKEYNNLT